jgi:putative ATP-dependent endonuclease of OLD family
MHLKTLQIENFRGITKLVLPLDGITVLIGENNTGKTSILEALHTCMNRGLSRRATPFSEYDFHLAKADAEPSDAPPLTITLTFEEVKEDEWPAIIDQAFDKAVQILDDNRKQLAFRVSAKYDKATRDFSVEWSFLDKAGNALPTAKQPKLVTDLQSLAPVFLLGAVRDAGQHFHAKSAFWGPFTKNPQIEDKVREEIEEQIGELNQAILDSHKPFEVVKDRLTKTGNLLPLAAKDLVSLEAIPARIFDMLARTQVKLGCRSGARLPIAQHGAGTQSLAVLFLFEAFLTSRLAEAFDKDSVPILALEEPEAHLHPSAIRALWSTLTKLPGQKLVATHSGDLLSAVPLKAIRRLACKNGKVEVFKIGDNTLDGRDEQKVSYHVRAKRGALLFARCWLLVEGETEYTMLPEFARLLGHDFELRGISCVEFSQCGLSPLIKTAKDLGIEWHVLADGDQSGKQYAKTADSLRDADTAVDRITEIADPDIEHCLWNAGYMPLYEAAVDRSHKAMVTTAPTDAKYPTETIKAAIASTSKPSLAYQIISAANASKSPGAPAALKIAIEKVIELAGRSACQLT